jgi:hypothetical protein
LPVFFQVRLRFGTSGKYFFGKGLGFAIFVVRQQFLPFNFGFDIL